jgi:hypothetical protein
VTVTDPFRQHIGVGRTRGGVARVKGQIIADCTIDGVARERRRRDGKVGDLGVHRQRCLERRAGQRLSPMVAL